MVWGAVSLLLTSSKKYSLVIPCYNEAAGLEDLVASCVRAQFPSNFEVILVDNGSTDNTKHILPVLLKGHSQIRSVRVEHNYGYGNGILFGLSKARGDVLGWTHADLQTDPEDFKAAIEFFERDGSQPFVKGKRFGRKPLDVFFTVSMSLFELFLLRKMLWDINAQPNVFSRSFYESWTNPPKDFSLDLYVYFAAKRAGRKICRFPVFFGQRKYGMSHWNIDWRSKLKFIRRTIHFSLELKKRHD